jgi:hypothetical protein
MVCCFSRRDGSVGSRTARDEGPTGLELPGLVAAAKKQHANHDLHKVPGAQEVANPGCV